MIFVVLWIVLGAVGLVAGVLLSRRSWSTLNGPGPCVFCLEGAPMTPDERFRTRCPACGRRYTRPP